MSLNVVGSIGLENVAVGVTVTGTPRAPSTGVRAVTAGGAESVVKRHATGDTSGTWSAVSTAVEKLAVYVVEGSSCAPGVSVTVLVRSS
jgi:hypothetical protein